MNRHREPSSFCATGGLWTLTHQLLKNGCCVGPRRPPGSSTREPLAHRQRRNTRAMDRQEHIERPVKAVELAFIKVYGSNAGGDATLGRRSLKLGEACERRRRLVEFPATNVYLAEESQSPDMVRIEHRHVLEGPKGAL